MTPAESPVAIVTVPDIPPRAPGGAPPRAPRREDPRLREALDVLDGVARGLMRQIGGRFELDELKGYAHEAVADLVARFDESRGVSFRSYARLRLRGAIIDGLRRESGLPRGVASRLRALEAADLYVQQKAEEHGGARPTSAEAADARVSSFLKGLATAYATGLVGRDDRPRAVDAGEQAELLDPEESAGRAEMRALLEKAIADMPDPERTLLRRHYFMDEDLQDAAAHLGLSKSWGSRLHARAIEKLAEKLASLRSTLER